MPNEISPQQPVYFVVLFSLPDDPHAIRDMLVEHLGLHPSEAQIIARSAPGVLPHRFVEDQAAALVRAATQLGVAAAALAERDVPDFEHVQVAHHARCVDAGLEIIDLRGQVTAFIEWPHLRVLSIGYVSVDRSRDFQVEASGTTSMSPHLRFPPTDRSAHAGMEAWLVQTNPLQGVRIDYNLMNYEYLGERKTPSAAKNFRLFIDDVLKRSQNLYLTPATRAFLDHGPLRHYEFHSPEELRVYTQFHTLLAQRAVGGA